MAEAAASKQREVERQLSELPVLQGPRKAQQGPLQLPSLDLSGTEAIGFVVDLGRVRERGNDRFILSWAAQKCMVSKHLC